MTQVYTKSSATQLCFIILAKYMSGRKDRCGDICTLKTSQKQSKANHLRYGNFFVPSVQMAALIVLMRWNISVELEKLLTSSWGHWLKVLKLKLVAFVGWLRGNVKRGWTPNLRLRDFTESLRGEALKGCSFLFLEAKKNSQAGRMTLFEEFIPDAAYQEDLEISEEFEKLIQENDNMWDLHQEF